MSQKKSRDSHQQGPSIQKNSTDKISPQPERKKESQLGRNPFQKKAETNGSASTQRAAFEQAPSERFSPGDGNKNKSQHHDEARSFSSEPATESCVPKLLASTFLLGMKSIGLALGLLDTLLSKKSRQE